MNDRKILLDTETTGFNFKGGDKIVEVACFELFDDVRLGEKLHIYVNPNREIPMEATRVHGITNERVAQCKLFKDIAIELAAFIGSSKVIAHNAEFDRAFINSEMAACNQSIYEKDQFIDTLELAKNKFPKQRNSLDALCERFSIDKTARLDYHGALIDIILLKDVYINLLGIQKSIFELADKKNAKINITDGYTNSNFAKREFSLTTEETEKHNAFVASLKNAAWLQY